MQGKSKYGNRPRTGSKSSDGQQTASLIGTESLDGTREHIFTKTEFDHNRLMSNQSSFSQVPMKRAGERADSGSLIIGELCKIFQVIFPSGTCFFFGDTILYLTFQGRVDMEDREISYSVQVSKPNLYEYEIRLSTSERALG